MSEGRPSVAEGTVEERLARLEGLAEQMDKRLSDLREDVGGIRLEMHQRFAEVRQEMAELRQEIRELRGRFWWLIGIMLSMWVTIIIAILFKG